MRVGVITFPGTLDDIDAVRAVRLAGGEPVHLWHADHDLRGVDAIVVPGGFSYGDYLRAGAIAARAPLMDEVVAAAGRGMPVLGICNGFQILCEAGLLPGALQKNAGLKFLCATVEVVVESSTTSVTSGTRPGNVLRLPINHFEGNFTCSPETMAELIEHDQIVFRYRQNPNGSMGDVAGVCNRARNVVGLMPHPERASHELLGSTDGRAIFAGLLAAAGDEQTVALATSRG